MNKNTKKLKIVVLFGGKSVEHEVSLLSAKNIIKALDKNKYEIILVRIDKDGFWHLENENNFLLSLTKPRSSYLNKNNKYNSSHILSREENKGKIDVIFPVLHGTNGEDGTIQGFLKFINLPFVGSTVLSSSVCFDKDVAKKILTKEGIPNTPFLSFKQKDNISFDLVKKFLGLPLIIKPANSGSSVGINKVNNKTEFNKSVKYAFNFDNKIIIEKFIDNKREIECAVLGNEKPKVSVCGEVITNKKYEFYSYEAKYLEKGGAILKIPANISGSTQKKIQSLAIKSFKALECDGLARVDFFLLDNGEILVNEVNTMPGFTDISMYPQLWGKSGLSYSKLIDKLIELAIKKHKKDFRFKTSYL